MRGVNEVTLIGNATRDAELRHTQNGKSVSSIRLATTRQIKGKEETQFHTIVCWNRLAKTPAEYDKKDDPLYVQGQL
jgi:single-strand DNA-binding protein